MSNARREALIHQFETWGYDNRGWAPNTRIKYSERVRLLERWLRENGNKSVLWANRDDLRRWLFSTPTNASTRNAYRQAAVAFFEFLVDAGYIDANHALSLPRLPESEAVSDALSRGQAFAIEQTVKLYPRMHRCLVWAFLYLALRKTEARTLEWVRMDLEDGWVRFLAKGQKDRVLPLDPRIMHSFRRWRVDCPDPRWVFPSPHHNGRPVSNTWVAETIEKIGGEAGVPNLHPHQLRHTYATRFIEQGGDIRSLQEILGHSSIGTTQRYLRVRPVRLREAMGLVDYSPED